MSEPIGSSELKEELRPYIRHLTNQEAALDAMMDNIEAHTHALLKSKLSELLEKKETYTEFHDDGSDRWETYAEAVPISEVQQLLDQLEEEK